MSRMGDVSKFACLLGWFMLSRRMSSRQAGTPILKLLEKMATSSLPHGQLHDVTYLLRP